MVIILSLLLEDVWMRAMVWVFGLKLLVFADSIAFTDEDDSMI